MQDTQLATDMIVIGILGELQPCLSQAQEEGD
jgi:hypothetical protein